MIPLQGLRLAWARRRCRLTVEAQALAAPLPPPDTPFDALEVVALDFETTGLDPARDQILAAGWVLVRGGRVVLGSARELRVRPRGEGVGQSAVIHGLLDSDLADATDEAALLDALMPVLAGRAIAAHAAMIERRFLDALLARCGGVPLPHAYIDTLSLERLLRETEGAGGAAPEPPGALTLPTARARRGLPPHGQHAAGTDAVACAELLLAQVAHLGSGASVRLRDLA